MPKYLKPDGEDLETAVDLVFESLTESTLDTDALS